MFPCIQFMLTAVRTYLFMMLPYLVNWSCQHPTLEVPQVRPPPHDKRSWHLRPTAPPFLYIYTIMKVLLQRYDMLRWTYWTYTLLESQRSVSLWNTVMNLWHFDCILVPA
jgi:hypothetical protein